MNSVSTAMNGALAIWAQKVFSSALVVIGVIR